MHTVMVISAGLVLLALFVVGSRLIGRPFRPLLAVYLVAWFVCAAVNMAVGISVASYTFMQELPIFLAVFAVPAVIAWVIARREA